MRKSMLLTLLALLLAGACAGAPAESAARRDTEVRRAIEAAASRWQTAVREEDAAGVAATYAEDAVFLPPGSGAIVGRDTIRGLFQAMFDAMDANYSFAATRIDVGGGRAWRWGSYEAVAVLPSGDTVRADDKFVDVWRLEADGTWRIVADIWNSNQVPGGAAAEESAPSPDADGG